MQQLSGTPRKNPSLLPSAVSSDGNVVVGYHAGGQAFKWSASSGFSFLPNSGDFFLSFAYDVSGDGTVIVGNGSSGSEGRVAVLWNAAGEMISLGDLPGGNVKAFATDISRDGHTVIGYGSSSHGNDTFLWTENEGMRGLWPFYAEDLSADASILVGSLQSTNGLVAAVWTEEHGAFPLEAILDEEGIDLGSWKLTKVVAVSDDGLTMTGRGINENGDEEGFVATIKDPYITYRGLSFEGPLAVFTDEPSLVTVVFKLTDTNGKAVDISRAEVEADGFLIVEENGVEISPSESFLQADGLTDFEGAKLQTVLLLDNSFSVFPDLDDIKRAARTLVDNALPQQEFALYSFSENPQLLQDFTSNKIDLHAAIDSIGLGAPTTDLYGSIIEGLSRWDDIFIRNDVRRGALVVLTDGNDQAGRYTTNDVMQARGEAQVFTIGLGAEINTNILNDIGNAGSYSIQDTSSLTNVFSEIQQIIDNDVNSLYWIQYVSPKRGDSEHRLSLRVAQNPYTGPGSVLNASFNSVIPNPPYLDIPFSSASPAVMINRRVFMPHGIDQIVLPEQGAMELKPFTILGLVASEYQWDIADSSIAYLSTNSAGGMEITSLALGHTYLTLTDVPNSGYLPGIYMVTIPVVVSNILADVDFDNLPDIWEQQIVNASGGSIPTINHVKPGDDFDGDGQTNLEEYIAGVDPTDSSSLFSVGKSVKVSGVGYVVVWQSVQGRLYGVHRKQLMSDSFQLLQDNIPYPVNSYTDTLHAAADAGFYKVDVKLK